VLTGSGKYRRKNPRPLKGRKRREEPKSLSGFAG